MILDFQQEVSAITEALGLDPSEVSRRQGMQVAMILLGVLDRGIMTERRRVLDIVARKAMNAAALRDEINRPVR